MTQFHDAEIVAVELNSSEVVVKLKTVTADAYLVFMSGVVAFWASNFSMQNIVSIMEVVEIDENNVDRVIHEMADVSGGEIFYLTKAKLMQPSPHPCHFVVFEPSAGGTIWCVCKLVRIEPAHSPRS